MNKQLIETVKENKEISKAYSSLEKENLIFPGSIIEGTKVEEVLGKKHSEDWLFLGPFILLKNKIESEGFFITQDGIQQPGFRILSSEEMADYGYKKLMRNLASNFKIGYVLAAHDTGALTEKQKKEHEFVQKKAAQSALMQQKLLFEDCVF